MFSNASNRTGLKQGKSALKLSRRQASLERQSDARIDVVDELRSSAEESPRTRNVDRWPLSTRDQKTCSQFDPS